MEFKWIQEGELESLNVIFTQMGWTPLPPTSLAFVAYDEKGIAGFHVLQLKAHAEPLWVRPDMVGTGLSADLAGTMAQFLSDTHTNSFMAIADTPEAEKLCKKFGMKKVTSPVYVK